MTSLNREAYNRNINQITDSLRKMADDLTKAISGNKAATQRFRSESVKFEKIAKLFRKLSIWIEQESRGLDKKKEKASDGNTQNQYTAH
jgi:Histone H1-like protein Hc1